MNESCEKKETDNLVKLAEERRNLAVCRLKEIEYSFHIVNSAKIRIEQTYNRMKGDDPPEKIKEACCVIGNAFDEIESIYKTPKNAEQIDKSHEYKSLRDEMTALFQRNFVILTAEVTAFVLLLNSALGQPSPLRKLAVLTIIPLLQIAGILINLFTYTLIYRIGSYLVVYFENAGHSPGWITRARHVHGDSKSILKNLKWFEKWPTEQRVVIGLYGLMIFVISSYAAWHVCFRKILYPNSTAFEWDKASIALVIILSGLIIFCCIALYFLERVYKVTAKRWVDIWDNYKTQCLDKNAPEFLRGEKSR